MHTYLLTYLQYNNANVHKTYQGGDMFWRISHPYICINQQCGGHVKSHDKSNKLLINLQDLWTPNYAT